MTDVRLGPSGDSAPALLRGARLADDRIIDLRVRDGVVVAVGSLEAAAEEQVFDLHDYLLLPAFADPHVHLDKAFTSRPDAAGGELADARTVHESVLQNQTPDDVRRRTERAALLFLANGCTAIRAQTGCGRLTGISAIEAVADVRRRLSGLIDIQIVAHIGGPAAGTSWRDHVAILRDAIAAGADLVGGNPFSEDDPQQAMDACLQVAVETGCPVDFHTDETTDPAVLTVRALAGWAATTGAEIPVTASHCISLGSALAGIQAIVAGEIADARMNVVTLPLTSLHLQGRTLSTGNRGLTALDALAAAGVLVAAGSDNIQDAFNPVGRCDPLEIASALVTVGHRGVGEALTMVSGAARQVMGLPPVGPNVGSGADFVAIRCRSVQEAVALAPADRLVFKAGRLVAHRSTHGWIDYPPGAPRGG